MKKNKYLISGATEQGLRERNEDSYDFAVNNSNQALLIVCDGIGSDEHSEIVSSSTTKLFTDEFKKINRIDDITMFFEKTLNEAYEHITNISFNYLKGKKMGTTLVMAFINTDGKVTIYNIGDSRLFYFNKKNWRQITKDQNYFNFLHHKYSEIKNMMKKDGKYTQKDYDEIDQKEKNDIKKNQDQLLSLTECLESDSDSHTHYVKYEINVKKDDMLLLVSDGVYNWIKTNDVNNLISKDFKSTGQKIVDLALKNNSNDNATALLCKLA